MSTKIYNGFKIKALNLKEQKAFISDVKKRATEYYLDIYIEGLSRRIVEFVDTLSVLDYNKDFERLGLALKSRYYKRLSISKIISKARLGDIVKVSDEEITKLFQMPHYSLMSFMQDVVEEDIKHCEISNSEKEYIDIDECRDDFYHDVLRILSGDGNNYRANQIIDIFDNLPTVKINQCEKL